MNTLPRPLVVWHNTVACDRCGGDVTVLTDGRRVHATTVLTWEHWSATEAERDGTFVTVRCGTPDINGEAQCGNLVAVDLSTEWWTTTPTLIDRLVTEGVTIP